MGSSSSNLEQAILRRFFAGTALLGPSLKAVLAALLMLFALSSIAAAQTKSLKLYYLHTGEKAEIVFKRNGRFDQAGLKKINWFLRDWRRNEPTKMDPNLLDLIWEVYRKTGTSKYIHVISGFRSPISNEMLRKRGRGVAKNSQHTKGKAMDFFIPGVKLSKLREIGLKLQVGGVGYYPKSGSPFVHMDTGNVRHWPRMSRSELARVFPDGKTMHVPSDGKPLARYNQAVADYKRRSANGKLVPQSKPTAKELNFFQRLAKASREDEDDDATVSAPAPRPVTTTKPAATPQPVAPPAPAEPEQPQFAALPSAVPVPVVAPRRNTITAGTPVAAETPAPADEPVIAEPAVEETTEPDAGTALAGLSPPVPAKRPEINPVIAMTSETPEPVPAGETTELAMLPPAGTPVSSRSAEPLSPAEIEELRKLVRPQVSEPVAASVVTDRPVPAATIGNAPAPTPATPAPAMPAPTKPAIVERQPLPAPQTEAPAIAQAEPVKTPEAGAEAPQAGIELAALPIEPGVESTGAIAVPRHNPVATETAEAAAEPADPVEEKILMASVPIPVRAPRPEPVAEQPAIQSEESVMVTASLETPPAEEAPAVPATPELQQRPVSLDKLSAPQDNSSTIGKWALSAGTTISELADVQAPAYGRNLIRQVPNAVIVQQFALQAFGPGQNRFNGKAVKPMKFARLQ